MKQIIGTIMILSVTAALFTMGGCGSGGGGSSQGAVVTTPSSPTPDVNSYSLTEDTYGLQNATFLSATNDNGTFVMRAAIAESVTDPDFRTVFRIDIVQPQLIGGPGTHTIGISGSPVEILFFNGHKSTMLNTVSGNITFTSYGVKSGDLVAGTFTAVVEDQSANDYPRPTYTITGNFKFVINTSGKLEPATTPVPVAAVDYYDAKCANCHALESLSMKGGELDTAYAEVQAHANTTIQTGSEEMKALKILLNAI